MKKNILIIVFALVFIVPFIASYIKWDGVPPGYGLFPAQKMVEVPGFNLPYFIFACVVAFIIFLFFVFPRIFGFKKEVKLDEKQLKKVDFPYWFYPSLVITLVSWLFMWVRTDLTALLSTYSFVPLWWGFIFVLDGIVYKRNGGVSLVSSKPTTMKILAVVSAGSWFVFEYLNFFVVSNWYYPNNQILSNFGNISWQLLSYTTVLPAVFEWYLLLKTFQKLNNRYKYGRKISFSTTSKWVFLFLGFGLLFLMGYIPFVLFWVLWICLIPALVPALSLAGYWTPFSEISKKGDWSFVALIALATMLNGFFWEFWNFGSEWLCDYEATNPNYWKYSITYLDTQHYFSEMPILGYFGYLFFGNVCWLLWLILAYIIGFDPSISISLDKNQNNNE